MRYSNGIRGTERGFTLIELLVVVLVLAALAAIIVPRFMGVEEMAEQGAAAMNIGKVNEVINGHVALTDNVPNGLDLLNEDTAIFDPNVLSFLTSTTLSQQEYDALQLIGLVDVYDGSVTLQPLAVGDKVYRIQNMPEQFIGGAWQDMNGSLIFGLGPHIQPYENQVYNASVSFDKPGTYPGLMSNNYRYYLMLIRYDQNTAEYLGCIDPMLEGQG